MRAILILAISVLAACSSADDVFTDCHIGELTGTWRTHYSETDGDCGPISDE